MNDQEFIIALKELNIEINETQQKQLKTYADFLTEYNQHTNLTRIVDISQIYLKHFYDSLTLVKEIDFNKINNILDIGTGAGFPGMVLKILFPHLKVTLLDSNQKKITFLEQLKLKLSVDNTIIIHSRAEEFAKNHQESFDLVTSRAVANMLILCELAIPMVRIGGNFVAMKGTLENEENFNYAAEILGGTIININKFELPFEKSIRNLINIKKISSSPQNYPRAYDKIIKKPLKKKAK